MADTNLTKILPRQFAGSAAENGNLAVFGSLAAGNPQFTKNPALIQSLSQFLNGWRAALSGNSSAPRLEDFNGLFYLLSSLINYIFQKGVAAYDAGETYFPGCVCSHQGNVWMLLGSASGNGLKGTAPSMAAYQLFIANTPEGGATGLYWHPMAQLSEYLVTTGFTRFLLNSTTPAANTVTRYDLTSMGLPFDRRMTSVRLQACNNLNGINGMEFFSPTAPSIPNWTVNQSTLLLASQVVYGINDRALHSDDNSNFAPPTQVPVGVEGSANVLYLGTGQYAIQPRWKYYVIGYYIRNIVPSLP